MRLQTFLLNVRRTHPKTFRLQGDFRRLIMRLACIRFTEVSAYFLDTAVKKSFQDRLIPENKIDSVCLYHVQAKKTPSLRQLWKTNFLCNNKKMFYSTHHLFRSPNGSGTYIELGVLKPALHQISLINESEM